MNCLSNLKRFFLREDFALKIRKIERTPPIFVSQIRRELVRKIRLSSQRKTPDYHNQVFHNYSLVNFCILCSVTIKLTMDIITATKIAAPKEEKPNLAVPTKLEVILNMPALITKVNKPSERKFNGRDNNTKKGRKNPFRIDKTKAAINAVNKLATWNILGKMTVKAINVKVFTNSRWK